MRFIVITSPDFISGEVSYIRQLFDCGIDILHLRKPGASAASYAGLLDSLPQPLHRHIVIHDHFTLCRGYSLLGVHLNSRNPILPAGIFPQSVSASCHSVAEVAARKPALDYVLMSPVFDSISKQGYTAAYSHEELNLAAANEIIDSHVVALGGVSLGNIPSLRRWHFGGAAFLGDVWRRAGTGGFVEHIRKLKTALDEDI